MIPPGGLDVFGNGFLPASYQGTLFRRGEHPVADLEPREPAPELQRSKLDFLRNLSKGVLDRFGEISELEATVANYELAFRMQAEVPDLLNFSGESETIGECTDWMSLAPENSDAPVWWLAVWCKEACASWNS